MGCSSFEGIHEKKVPGKSRRCLDALLLRRSQFTGQLPKKHDEKPKEHQDQTPQTSGDTHATIPLVQGRLRVCPGVDCCKGGVVGVTGNRHRIPVKTELERIRAENAGDPDVPRCFGADLRGLC